MNVSGAALRMAVMGLVVGAVLVACTLGPDYQRAAVSVPVAYKESSAVQPATIVPPADDAWWRLYGDTTLTALVERVTVNNFNLAASEASYRAATAALVSVRAGQWPSITSDVQLTRSLGAQNSGNAVTAGGGSGARTLARLGGAVSWELDLWGRVRRSVEQSRATAAASAADLAVLQLSLRGTLVSTYFALRVAQAERTLLDDNVDALRRALQITQNRYRVGVAARLDVAQAETQLATTRAQAIDVGVRCATLEHALASLLGVAPAEFVLAPASALPPPAVAPTLPSTLLERRPDIAAAERRMAAANAAIGIAQAAWFPTLSLGGAAGFQHSNLIDLVSLPYHFWSVGPALAGTLFDGGRRRGQRDEAVALYEQSVAQYRQTVLDALVEVEDGLASLRVLGDEARVQDEAVHSAREAQKLAENQYKGGTVSYLNVVTAQTAALNAARSALDIQGRQLSASVALYQALGGAP